MAAELSTVTLSKQKMFCASNLAVDEVNVLQNSEYEEDDIDNLTVIHIQI
jgi:hypothetical protein